MALFGRMNSLAPMCFMGAATPKTAKAMIIIAVASSLCFGCPTGICWPGPSLPWFWRSSARTPSSHRPSSQGGLARLFVFGALYASEFFVIHPANRAGPSSVCFTGFSGERALWLLGLQSCVCWVSKSILVTIHPAAPRHRI